MRKIVCRYCQKIVPESGHSCIYDNHNRKKYNKYRKDYVEKNSETIKPLMSVRWRKLRLKIIARDSYHCQRCLIKYGIINGEKIEAHHIKSRLNYPELMFDENNIIAICQTCNVQLGNDDKLDFKWNPPDDTNDDGFIFNL